MEIVRNSNEVPTSINGVEVKATLRSALLYKSLTGNDYLADIMALEKGFNGKGELDTGIVLDFLKTFIITANKDNESKFETMLDNEPLSVFNDLVEPIMELILNNAQQSVKSDGAKKGK